MDDGSSDRTVEIAHAQGVDHIISHPQNLGLGAAFATGLNACLARGADVILNTDADNQYNADDIPLLTQPILEARADMVIGTRPITSIAHFSLLKKILQKTGSAIVQFMTGIEVKDAVSGFRAFSRQAAMRLNVFSKYSYALETIIQARPKNIIIAWVPIRTNPITRPSRLIKSMPNYIWRSACIILRVLAVYRPFRFFCIISALLGVSGLMICVRFLWLFAHGQGTGHIQSLVLAAILLGIGFQTLMMAFLAEMFRLNRQLLEDIQFRLNKNSLDAARAKP